MIKKIEDNDVFEAIQLMNKSTKDNEYYGYKRNESVWIQYFLSLVEKQKQGSFHDLVIGDYQDNKLRGFLSASTFSTYYTNEYVMDVKDCIVDHDYNNAYTVYRLFDAMIAHVKEHGGKHWRADSIRSEQEAMDYGRFLQRRYDAAIHVSVRGVIQEK
tara:strand:- start:41 stop:514 length:474 start_codon:yes stop_codon:yes gene_type:complete